VSLVELFDQLLALLRLEEVHVIDGDQTMVSYEEGGLPIGHCPCID
jgi:hypothetical protein